MYPIPAVLVNCGDVNPIDIRATLTELAVLVEAEFAQAEDAIKKWPVPPVNRKVFVVRVAGRKQVAATERLADAFPGWPIIALVDGSVDAAGLYAVSRAGAAQILPYPTTADELSLALARVSIQYALSRTPARVVVVTGAAAGSGATTVAVNLAAEFAGLFELATVLAELELVLGRLPGLLNLTPPVSIRDLLALPAPPLFANVKLSLSRIGNNLSVLTGPHQRVDPFEPAVGQVTHLLGILRRLTTIAVIDLPASFDRAYFEAIAAADRVVLIGRQDVPTIHAMKLVRDSLLSRSLPEPLLVLNHYDPELVTFSPTRVAGVLSSPVPRTVASDPSGVRQAADAGKPLSEVVPRSRATSDMRWLAAWVLKEVGFPSHEMGPRGDRRTLLGWLLGT